MLIQRCLREETDMYKNALYFSLGLALALAPVFADDTRYIFETKDYPGAINTGADGINNLGQIAGTYVTASSPAAVCGPPGAPNNPCVYHAFYEVNGVLTPVPGTLDNWFASYQNIQGILVGVFFDNTSQHSFALQNGVIKYFQDVNFPGMPGPPPNVTQLNFINDTGDATVAVYGFIDPASTAPPVAHQAIFRRNPGATDVTDGKWSGLPDFPGAYGTCGQGPTNNGWVWGGFSDKNPHGFGFGNCPGPGDVHGFIMSPDGHFTEIDYPGAKHQTFVFGLNNPGAAVGMYGDGKTLHGFLIEDVIGRPGQGIGKHTTVDFPGASLTAIIGINDNGDITGWYQMPGQRVGCDAVPPDSLCGNFHNFVAHKVAK
jgi:hypothetical protein